jgi:FAD/FMN-containing dehydrogenase
MLYDIGDTLHPLGRRTAVDCFWAATPATSFLGTVADRIATAPVEAHALALVLPPPPGPLPDAAFSMGGAIYAGIHAEWDDPADDARGLAFVRETGDAIADRTIGHYVGEADHERPGRLAACYAPAAWERLDALRRRYDPEGVFDRTGATRAALRAAG